MAFEYWVLLKWIQHHRRACSARFRNTFRDFNNHHGSILGAAEPIVIRVSSRR
jgi:hypothetical protein